MISPTQANARTSHSSERILYWDMVARDVDRKQGIGGSYHRRLQEIYRFLVPPGSRVLEIGCGRGELLAALKPCYGARVDFSCEMLKRAAGRFPELRFVEADGTRNPDHSRPRSRPR